MSGLCFGCPYKIPFSARHCPAEPHGKAHFFFNWLLGDSNRGIQGRQSEGKQPTFFFFFPSSFSSFSDKVLYPGNGCQIFLVYCSCFLSLFCFRNGLIMSFQRYKGQKLTSFSQILVVLSLAMLLSQQLSVAGHHLETSVLRATSQASHF